MNVEAEPPATVDYQGSDLECLANLRRYQRWIVDTFRPYLGGEAVEFGSGTGSISELLIPLVSSLDLVEPSPNLGERLDRRFAGRPEVRIHRQTLEAWAAGQADQSVDSAILVNVLEHIEDDRLALGHLHRILRPGGHLLLMVPALKFLFSDLDVFYGHHRRYGLGELRGRVGEAGFGIVRARYFDIAGIVPWWILNTLLGSTTFNPFLMRVYDTFFIPVTRAVESVVRPPLGKNLVLIGRRPD